MVDWLSPIAKTTFCGLGWRGASTAFSAQLRQLRKCIDRWRSTPDIDTIFLLGDLNSLDMGTAEVEAATGLHKLSSAEHTHATDGCIDHVLGSRGVVGGATSAAAAGAGAGGPGNRGSAGLRRHREVVAEHSREGERVWRTTTDVVDTASDHRMVKVDLVDA